MIWIPAFKYYFILMPTAFVAKNIDKNADDDYKMKYVFQIDEINT